MAKKDIMQGLFNAYNQKITPERAKAYSKWSDLNDEDIIEKVVDFVIGEDARMPAVSRLWSLSRDMFSKRAQDIPEEDCSLCDSTGFIPGVWKGSNGAWSHGIISSCKCSNGQRKKSKLIPQNFFEHDPRYLDLKKANDKETPWGCVPYFYSKMRSAKK
jgi:hypothetical protein